MSEALEIEVGPDADLAQVVNDAADGAVIVLSVGTYEATLRLFRSVTMRADAGAESVVIDADGEGPCVRVEVDDIDVVLEGVTLVNGSGEAGGALTLMNRSRVTLRDCVLTGNEARQAPGGAIYVDEGLLTLERCRVTSNGAPDAPAIAADLVAKLILRDTLVVDTVESGHAAIRVHDGVEAQFVRCTLVCHGGAAVHASGTSTRTPFVRISDSIVCGGPALDAPAPHPGTIGVARSVLSQVPASVFRDMGGTRIEAPNFLGEGPEPYRPGPDSPALGIANSGDATDLTGAERPAHGAAAGAIQP